MMIWGRKAETQALYICKRFMDQVETEKDQERIYIKRTDMDSINMPGVMYIHKTRKHENQVKFAFTDVNTNAFLTLLFNHTSRVYGRYYN